MKRIVFIILWLGSAFSTFAGLVFAHGLAEGAGPITIPEPATMLLVGSGLIGLAALGRRKVQKQ